MYSIRVTWRERRIPVT